METAVQPQSLEEFRSAYDVDTEVVRVGGRDFTLFVPRGIERFLDPFNPVKEFPLWVKIWPASVVLAEWVAAWPPDPRQRLIEIGGGLGLVSVVAAACGHRITMSEISRDALNFARANAWLNGTPPFPLMHLDWGHPPEGEKFDGILGSELVFRKEDVLPLRRAFSGLMRPSGEILLSGEPRATSDEFVRTMAANFQVRILKKSLLAGNRTVPVLLYFFKPLASP